MLKRMLNCPERITYDRLTDVCERRSALVYVKVRMADVLPVEGSGLSEGLYEFALQSHFDFVITDLEQKPLFAVEFDGPGHSYPAQVERDTKKDELSTRFNLPLPRIVAEDLNRSESRLDRLTEVTERWFNRSEFVSGNRRAVGNDPAVNPFDRGSNVTEKPLCPVCGSGMVVKDGRYGPFLSCARFPDCRGSCDLPGPSAPLNPRSSKPAAPTLHFIPRRWLFAGMVVLAVAIVSLLAVIARSNNDGVQVSRPARIGTGPDFATVRQMKLLDLLIKRRGWGPVERDAEIERVLGRDRSYSQLSKQEASKLITTWDDRRK